MPDTDLGPQCMKVIMIITFIILSLEGMMNKGYFKATIDYIFIDLCQFLFSIYILREDLSTHQNHPFLGLLNFLIPLPSSPCSSTKWVLNMRWTKRRNSELPQRPASSCLPSQVLGPFSWFTSTLAIAPHSFLSLV